MAAVALHMATDETKTEILRQLNRIKKFERSRQAKIVSKGVDGGPVWDCRPVSGLLPFGPFENTQDFHSFIREGQEQGPSEHPEIEQIVSRHKPSWSKLVFSWRLKQPEPTSA